jgi:hypothetical protein
VTGIYAASLLWPKEFEDVVLFGTIFLLIAFAIICLIRLYLLWDDHRAKKR